MWQTGSINPAQEHFISNLIRQKLIAAIDRQQPAPNEHRLKFILFLPDGELHELSLLYFNYLLRSEGHSVTYLGQSVPLEDLKRVAEIKKPDYLVSVLTHIIEKPETLIQELSSLFPETHILLSGSQVVDSLKNPPGNIKVFTCPQDLLKFFPQN